MKKKTNMKKKRVNVGLLKLTIEYQRLELERLRKLVTVLFNLKKR